MELTFVCSKVNKVPELPGTEEVTLDLIEGENDASEQIHFRIPQGQMTLRVQNPAMHGAFTAGEKYTFTRNQTQAELKAMGPEPVREETAPEETTAAPEPENKVVGETEEGKTEGPDVSEGTHEENGPQ